jgi:hypothetical protein
VHRPENVDRDGALRFSGLMLPLIKGSLPDFGPVFKSYANDLQREADRATP